MAGGNPPKFRLESFPVKVAVWEVPHKSRQGTVFYSYSIKMTKSYKENSTGNWLETEYLNEKELLQAAALLTEVYRKITFKESSPEQPAAEPMSMTPASPAAAEEALPY